jgi:predicted RNA-binding Zn-ribbon protein involved in translation (DUF1610 family)
MTKVKVSVEGHYEVEESPHIKHYKWVPAHALIECDCGQTMDVDTHHTTCPNCGKDYTDIVREVAGRHLSDEVIHPWHPDYEAWLSFKRDHPQEWLTTEVDKEYRRLADEE